MTVVGIIIIVLLVVSIPVSIADTYWNSKRTKVMEAQNVLLWAAVDQLKQFLAEALKEAENVRDKMEEAKVTIDGNAVFKKAAKASKQSESPLIKAGAKIRVVSLDDCDMRDTNLKIGDIGMIVTESKVTGDEDDVFYVMFNDDFECDMASANRVRDGSYKMCRNQLEVI